MMKEEASEKPELVDFLEKADYLEKIIDCYESFMMRGDNFFYNS
jgi:hypothetical protein